MATLEDLPHLITLLGDQSSVVQEELERAFCSIQGPLAQKLHNIRPSLSSTQLSRISELMEPVRRESLLQEWPSWRSQQDSCAQLESGLNCVASYQDGVSVADKLSPLLDGLARGFREQASRPSDPIALAKYLFGEGQLQGERLNYYHPRNSNLVHVIKDGTGNPISLTCVYILTGRRLEQQVQGCNFPGHFLARVRADSGIRFVDCFHGGEILDAQFSGPLQARATSPAGREALKEAATAEVILKRVLRNLIAGYRLLEQTSQADLFLYLLKTSKVAPGASTSLPDFSPGQLVEHRRYGYRGVVADYDLSCLAEESWYRSNSTQPDKLQPWYRVLVDGTDTMTYAAQTSLRPDSVGGEVHHPLTGVFFSSFAEGSYTRNPRPWPEL